jgi:hypothetical protein
VKPVENGDEGTPGNDMSTGKIQDLLHRFDNRTSMKSLRQSEDLIVDENELVHSSKQSNDDAD